MGLFTPIFDAVDAVLGEEGALLKSFERVRQRSEREQFGVRYQKPSSNPTKH